MPKQSVFEITITVDTNDADYATQVSKISESDLELIKPLIKAISKFQPYTAKTRGANSLTWDHHHNYPYGECCRGDLGEKHPQELYDFPQAVFEIFENLLPFNEYGFHTIDSIEVTPYVKKTKLL